MRSAAKIHVRPLPIQRNRRFLKIRDEFHLVRVVSAFEEFDRVRPRHFDAVNRQAILHDALHLFLDRGETLLGYGRREPHIVIEAVLDARSNAEARPREEVLDGLRHQMRGRVPNYIESLFRFGEDRLQNAFAGDDALKINRLSIQFRRNRTSGCSQRPQQFPGLLPRLNSLSFRISYQRHVRCLPKNKIRPTSLHGDDVGRIAVPLHFRLLHRHLLRCKGRTPTPWRQCRFGVSSGVVFRRDSAEGLSACGPSSLSVQRRRTLPIIAMKPIY